jgi:hypothetical protein
MLASRSMSFLDAGAGERAGNVGIAILIILGLLVLAALVLLMIGVADWLYSSDGGPRVVVGLWVLAGLLALIGYIAGSQGLMIAGACIAGVLVASLIAYIVIDQS